MTTYPKRQIVKFDEIGLETFLKVILSDYAKRWKQTTMLGEVEIKLPKNKDKVRRRLHAWLYTRLED